MTCKECLNADVCGHVVRELFKNEENQRINEVRCRFLKPKSRYIELPCAVGDTVYVPMISPIKTRILGLSITKIRIEVDTAEPYIRYCCDNGRIIKVFDINAFGKIVFLTKEEAEKALAEREVNNG